jgi:hypothetical protein
MESNLAQINVIRCKHRNNRHYLFYIIYIINRHLLFLWVQIYNYANEHKCTTLVYESTTYIYTCYLKSQTLNLSLFTVPLNPLYCISSLGPNFGVFESLHKEKHINSTRKRVQSAIQHIFHRKLAQFFENSTKLCEIYISRSVKNRHSILGVRNCARAYKGMG